MNTIQKFSIIVGIGSLVVFYVSVEGHYGYDWGSIHDIYDLGGNNAGGYGNIIGLIATFNIIASILIFLLFKDK